MGTAAFRIALSLFRMAEPQASGRPRLGGVGLSGKRRLWWPQLLSARSLGGVMALMKADLLHLYDADALIECALA